MAEHRDRGLPQAAFSLQQLQSHQENLNGILRTLRAAIFLSSFSKTTFSLQELEK